MVLLPVPLLRPTGNPLRRPKRQISSEEYPAYASDNWLGSATLIGTGGWAGFQFLFFMTDGDLYGVHSDKFYKRSVPTHGGDNWLGTSEMIGTGGWSVFKYLMSPLGPPGDTN